MTHLLCSTCLGWSIQTLIFVLSLSLNSHSKMWESRLYNSFRFPFCSPIWMLLLLLRLVITVTEHVYVCVSVWCMLAGWLPGVVLQLISMFVHAWTQTKPQFPVTKESNKLTTIQLLFRLSTMRCGCWARSEYFDVSQITRKFLSVYGSGEKMLWECLRYRNVYRCLVK